MDMKKWITKKAIADILKAYSFRTDEFEPLGDEGCSFKNKYLRGYVLSIEQECPYGSEKTAALSFPTPELTENARSETSGNRILKINSSFSSGIHGTSHLLIMITLKTWKPRSLN